jgi:hypothetical protein
MTSVVVNTRAHTVTHIAAKMLEHLKDILRLAGLNPGPFAASMDVYERGIATWLGSGDLQRAVLEIFDPKHSDKLIYRWDLEINYGYAGDGHLWTDPAAIKATIEKAGVAPASCSFRLILQNKPGRPDVEGWSPCTMSSTDGMKRYSVGPTIGGEGIASETSYWRRAC